LLHRKKAYPYLLVTVLEDLISYSNRIINLETESIQLKIKGKEINILFNILLLDNNKAALEMP
jgi:hypothetical protein